MARHSTIVSAIVAAAVAQTACVTTKTKTRRDPIYEMRRVEVGTRTVTRHQRVKVGEQPVTTVTRVPVGNRESGGSTPLEYEEKTVTTMQPVFVERPVVHHEPRYEWQRHLIRVKEHKYEVAETNLAATTLAIVLGAPVAIGAVVIIVLVGRGLGSAGAGSGPG